MSIHMCMSIHMPPAISKALRSCREPPDWAYRKFQVYRGRPALAADGAAKAVEHIAESIVPFQMHDKFNEPHRHASQRDKYANNIDPTELPCQLPCHLVAVLRRRSLNR
ncbi:MAG: hypothetical protein WBQ24_12165 [Xanthobacteraceae bacterium]